MFRFENTEYLLLLVAVVPFLLLIFYFHKRNSELNKRIVGNELLGRMMQGYNSKAGLIRNLIFLLSLVFLIIALVNPQWSNKRVKTKAESSDIFIALDISNSMLSPDISPSRLEKSKKIIQELIFELKGNRFGLIYFAGEAFLKMPLSTDYAASVLFVKSATPYMIENQGTAIEEAIKIALNASINDKKNQKALVIFSDGEDHDGDAVKASAEAKENGFKVFTVAAGSEVGGLIPFTDQFGMESYKKDDEGKYIKSKVNKTLLYELAEKGQSYELSDNDLVKKLVQNIEKMEKREIVQRSFVDFKSHYEYFILIAILLIIIYLMYPQIKLKN